MKINLLLAIAFLSFIAYANINYLHGIVGMTLRDGGLGCICHNFSPNDSVNVWIEGPDSVTRNSSHQYKILMTGGAAVAGGFNIANNNGILGPIDTLTQILFGELTHAFPNEFTNDTVYWNFLYTAPDTVLIDTIYSVGNSVNWDSIPSDFDQWNFGDNFAINVIDYPVNVSDANSFPQDFVLYQNYPNPFNPSTTLSFVIGQSAFVSLKVYDILGNEIAVLVNEMKSSGIYHVQYSPEFGIRNTTSGIYLYQLKAGSFIDTQKMIFLK
jgi:hypothetical protein